MSSSQTAVRLLAAGARFGAYEIEELIGSGGMGVVYRARDSKLGRPIAIKVLPEAFTRDSERRDRLDREAHVLATLNHPHIGAIYGVEDVGPRRGLILELVEGETLADRIRRGPVPMKEALNIAGQIADALAAAHEHGIVHRDLKPANIKITPAGQVKVLDFGLARLEPVDRVPPDVSSSPTVGVDMTRAGVLLGTAGYMSPEQARGSPVDARTDIWAFGCVLYEMLTAHPAFARRTIAETLAHVLEHEPAWDTLPPAIPAGIQQLLRRCLEKDPRRRMHSAADVRIAIEDTSNTPGAGAASRSSSRRIAAVLPWLAALAAIVLAATVAWTNGRRVDPDLPTLRLDVQTMPASDLASFALSPDGRRLVFVASANQISQLWVRELARAEPQRIAGTEGASYPFWAPDSRSIGFFAGGLLKRVDLGGGRPQVLAQARNPMGGAWNHDDVMLYVPYAASPVMRVPARGGTPVAITHLRTGELSHRFPFFLPDGRRFLILVMTKAPETEGVYLASTDAPDMRHRVLSVDSNAEYAAPGYLLAVRDGVATAVRFDAKSERVSGEPMPLAARVAGRQGRGALSVSPSGLLAYHVGTQEARPPDLTWIRRDGTIITTLPARGYVSSTRDGQRIAISGLDPASSNDDIWVMDLTRRIPQRFTFEPEFEISPVWSPDGSRLAFASNRSGAFDLFEKPANFASDARILAQSPTNKFPVDWSPDGRVLMFVKEDAQTGDDLWTITIAEPHSQVRFTAGPAAENQGQFSPDGRWVAYRSNESGQWEIYVRPYPGPGTQQLVSRGGGTQPRWRADGKELFYIGADSRLMAVSIHLMSRGDTLEIGAAVPLFTTHLWGSSNQQWGYVVDPTGQRFLMDVGGDETNTTPITIMQNWIAGLGK